MSLSIAIFTQRPVRLWWRGRIDAARWRD